MGKTNSPALNSHFLKFTDCPVCSAMVILDILILMHFNIHYFFCFVTLGLGLFLFYRQGNGGLYFRDQGDHQAGILRAGLGETVELNGSVWLS